MQVLSLLLAASVVAATPLVGRQVSGTATVTLSNNTGEACQLASGFIYGIPDTPNQIPDHFYTDMGFKYGRAGGAQIPAPGRGWIWNEYPVRYASALSNYRTTRKYNGEFIFLIHDLWGADGTQNSSAPYPGDNGDWSSWDAFLTRFIHDTNKNHATEGLSIDIWNEPDLSYFWTRGQAQYLQMWGRTYHRLRKEWPDVKLTGPAFAGYPDPLNTWWTNFLPFVKANASIPDQWVWHMEGGGSDMESAYGALFTMLQTYGLPNRQLNIDEYATLPEQVPSGSAWWIAQLERVNAFGLRGNWLSGYRLHDFMSNLVSKPNADNSAYNYTQAGYFPNGAYQVYKYYHMQMTGHRVGSSPSADLKIDTYTTVSDMVRILTGVRITVGTWQITVDDLSAVGLPVNGTLNIHTWGFPTATNVYYGEVDAPTDLGWYAHEYTGNSVTFPVFQVDTTTAYAFEFHVGRWSLHNE